MQEKGEAKHERKEGYPERLEQLVWIVLTSLFVEEESPIRLERWPILNSWSSWMLRKVLGKLRIESFDS